MGSAKIEIKVGGISFSGEGEQAWIAAQLDKVLRKADEIKIPSDPSGSETATTENNDAGGNGASIPTLSKFLTASSVGSNQTRKFLATAVWLTRKQNKRLWQTTDVVNALQSNHQGKLKNASQCLNTNVTSGMCEKSGKSNFYVTDEGLAKFETA